MQRREASRPTRRRESGKKQHGYEVGEETKKKIGVENRSFER